MPAGPEPKEDWSRGFFELATEQGLATVAIVARRRGVLAERARRRARERRGRPGLEIVYDKTYPPRTTDFTPIVRAIQATNPDVVLRRAPIRPIRPAWCSAANELGLKTKLFGGGMVGLQFAAIQKNLGPLLNGIVNYDFWVPEPTLNFPGIQEFLTKYQEPPGTRASTRSATTCRRSPTPTCRSWARRSRPSGCLDQAGSPGTSATTTFDTVVGPVKFGTNGEWATSRVLMVQFRERRDRRSRAVRQAGKRVVLYPKEWKSGELIVPLPAYKR